MLDNLTPNNRVVITRKEWQQWLRKNDPVMNIGKTQYVICVSSIGGGKLEARLEKV